MPSDVVRHLTYGAFVARTTETGDRLFQTTRDGRRARLLQTDDVATETETEVAMVIARDLLSGHVNLSVEKTGAGWDWLIDFRVTGRR